MTCANTHTRSRKHTASLGATKGDHWLGRERVSQLLIMVARTDCAHTSSTGLVVVYWFVGRRRRHRRRWLRHVALDSVARVKLRVVVK